MLKDDATVIRIRDNEAKKMTKVELEKISYI